MRRQPNATGWLVDTVLGMRPLNHVDGRRQLTPRDYFADQRQFGRVPGARPTVPAGGDPASAAIALVQHRLICRWRSLPQRPSGAELGRTYGFSRQVFSRAVNGERWLGETVTCALLVAIWAATPTRTGTRTTRTGTRTARTGTRAAGNGR